MSSGKQLSLSEWCLNLRKANHEEREDVPVAALYRSYSLQVLSALQTEQMEYDQILNKLVVLYKFSLADLLQKVNS